MVATAFELPAVDDGDEVELAAWLVEAGDSVTEGQPIAEVETEKSVVEIDTPYDGTVSELLVDEWTVVATGEEIAIFSVDESALDESGAGETPADDADTDDADKGQAASVEAPDGRVFAPPRVRRLARELGVDITTVEGSDHGGRITDGDVHDAADEEDDSGPKPFTPSGKSAVSKSGESVSGAGLSDDDAGPKPFTPSGKSAVSKGGKAVSSAGISDEPEVGESQGAHVSYATATVEQLVELHQESEPEEVEAGVLPFVLKALGRVCEEHDLDGSQISLGVRTDGGLAVSVVSVGDSTFREVVQETADCIEQIGETNDKPAVVVTEPGALGGGYATPPLDGATVAVSLGALEARPVVEDGAVVARKTLPVSLAVNETVEPVAAAAVLSRLVNALESPSQLLLDSR